jgi:hypothetical protein
MAAETSFFVLRVHGHQNRRNCRTTLRCELAHEPKIKPAEQALTAIPSQLFNKVAGVYGLIAIFTGGTLAQLTMYIYSILGLLLFVWGLRAVAAVSRNFVQSLSANL